MDKKYPNVCQLDLIWDLITPPENIIWHLQTPI